MTADLKMSGREIISLGSPTSGNNATTKDYVDDQVASKKQVSVFTSHVIKTKNRNHSIKKFKNLGDDR